MEGSCSTVTGRDHGMAAVNLLVATVNASSSKDFMRKNDKAEENILDGWWCLRFEVRLENYLFNNYHRLLFKFNAPFHSNAYRLDYPTTRSSNVIDLH